MCTIDCFHSPTNAEQQADRVGYQFVGLTWLANTPGSPARQVLIDRMEDRDLNLLARRPA